MFYLLDVISLLFVSDYGRPSVFVAFAGPSSGFPRSDLSSDFLFRSHLGRVEFLRRHNAL